MAAAFSGMVVSSRRRKAGAALARVADIIT
jgi:hypothetical protein